MGKKQNKTSIGKVWQWCNPCALMMGVENGTTAMENSFVVP
jgi:hypothetical protein